MNVGVAGAGSRTGRFLVERLARDGHTVRPLTRADGVDVTRPDTLAGRLTGLDAVISLVGASLMPTWKLPEQTFQGIDRQGNLNLLDAAVRAGVPRFVYLSVFGEYPPGVRYVEAHRDVEQALQSSPLTSTSVRPTGFFSSFEVLAEAARWGVGARIGDGTARTNPLHEADLADVLADHVASGPAVMDVGGPDILTRDQITDLLFAAAGRTPRVVPLPVGLLRFQGGLIRPFNPRIADLIAFLAHILTHDEVAPSVGTRRLTDHIPRA